MTCGWCIRSPPCASANGDGAGIWAGVRGGRKGSRFAQTTAEVAEDVLDRDRGPCRGRWCRVRLTVAARSRGVYLPNWSDR